MASLVLEGMASTYLETLSTANEMYSSLKEDGNGPMKSLPQTSKICTTMMGLSGIQYISSAYSTQLLAPRVTLTVFKTIPK